ncbi:hypothetical protein AAC387_Pa05g1775 [Persea americana]
MILIVSFALFRNAFTKAWKATCSAAGGTPTLLLPQGKRFLLKPIIFKGPCKSSSIHIQVLGDVAGPSTIPEWNKAPTWLDFQYVDNLTIDGTGRIGGQGSIWWPCKKNRNANCPREPPTAMSFAFCNGLVLSGVHLFDNPKNHIHTLGCNGSVFSHLTITAPKDSPNTDGINIASSKNVQIYNCTIGTGDDCISVLNDTSNVNISYITCGPGHGISIGSLGKGGSVGIVEQIHVSHSNFTGTMNGARIKTWQGGSGYVRGISFQDIILDKVQTAIGIDQFYPALSKTQDIQVSDVSFIGVRGTSTALNAIFLKCSGPKGCTNVILNDINITSAMPIKEVQATCQNVRGPACKNCTPKVSCLG